jgi:hypothetical protein
VLVAADTVEEPAPKSPSPRHVRPSKAVLLEALLVVASPAVLFFVLRLRAMAPPVAPDPAMHTTYIIDPRDFFARFSSELGVVGGTREGARPGLLVPARLSYLAFGAVRGFFVFRYVLALVAVVPSYVLLRRLASRAAGAMAIVILMSSPVLVTAWGTDYPDSAIVSYMTGGLACLAMPCRDKRRTAWLAAAAALLTMAVWSHVDAVPLVGVTIIAYFAVCLLRTPRRLGPDALVLAASAALVTVALMLGSGLLLGPYDYVLPTLRSYRLLNSPSVIRDFHSANPRWILLRPYLLVPVAAVGVWAATFLRRLSDVPTPQLLIGLACVAQIAVDSYLQFLGHAEVLQQHYYSSGLWATVYLLLAVTVAALAKPLFEHRLGRFLPAMLVLVLALADEADRNLPAFGWLPSGLLIVAAIVAAAATGRFVSEAGAPAARATAAAVVVVIMGGSLILTVAPYEHHARLPGVVKNAVPAYATALGGSDGDLIDKYRVATELPGFVGNSTTPGERVMMWLPPAQLGNLVDMVGMYHANINELVSSPPRLTLLDRELLQARRPAEVLVFDTPNFPATLRALERYDPTFLRATVLRSGNFELHVWLISLGVYMHRAKS